MKLERVERLNLTLSAGAVAATWAFASPHVASSLAIGAALEAMNFGALHRSARLYLGGGVRGAGPWLAVFSTRFVLLAAGILIAVQAGAHPVALLCGLSIAVPAVLIDAWLHRPHYDPASQAEWDVPPPDDESWDRFSIWRPWEQGEAGEAESENEGGDGDAAGRAPRREDRARRATLMADAADAITQTVGVDVAATDSAEHAEDAQRDRPTTTEEEDQAGQTNR